MNDSSNSVDPPATGAHPNTGITVTHKAASTDKGTLTSSQTYDGAGNTHTQIHLPKKV